MNFSASDIARFRTKFIVGAHEKCWIWSGSRRPSGYGKFKAARKEWAAHRISYLLFHGQDPGDMFVCHKCDVPGCVNPSHLFLGTASDNIRDCVTKGRHAYPWGAHFTDRRGEKNGRAKLTLSQVQEIRSKVGITHAALAAQYGVSKTLIGDIKQGLRWAS